MHLKKDKILPYFTVLLVVFWVYYWIHKINIQPDFQVLSAGTFNQNVYVFITEDTSMVREYIPNADFSAAGFTYSDSVGPVMIWFPCVDKSVESRALVAHELSHATTAILRGAGIELNEYTEEVYAYELAHLTQEFYSINK